VAVKLKDTNHFRSLLLLGTISAMLIAAVLLLASRAGVLPEAPDQFTYDWRTLLFSDTARETRRDIAVVLITEDSLTGYPYISPVDRELLADVVRKVDAGRPKAIGLDFIFDRPTEPVKDAALKDALRSAQSTVILGAIDGRSQGLTNNSFPYQDAFLKDTGRDAGHLYFVNQSNQLAISDQAIRYIAEDSVLPPSRRSLAKVLAEVDGKKPDPASRYIAWLLPPNYSDPTFMTFRVRAHRDETGKLIAEPFPESWRAALKGKIVLIGAELFNMDRHLTPLSVASDTRMTGVFIHAQILAQLRDGRSIYTIALWQELLAAAVIAGLGYLAAVRWSLHSSEWLVSAGALTVLIAVGLLLFYQFNFVLPSSTLVLAWMAGLFVGNWCERAIKTSENIYLRFRRRRPEGV
jgi:adenylate cyclase